MHVAPDILKINQSGDNNLKINLSDRAINLTQSGPIFGRINWTHAEKRIILREALLQVEFYGIIDQL